MDTVNGFADKLAQELNSKDNSISKDPAEFKKKTNEFATASRPEGQERRPHGIHRI